MKPILACVIMIVGISAMADTIVIRQPGLIEGLGQAVFGTVRCVGEFATGFVAGNTTVVQTPTCCAPAAVYTAPAVVAPTPVTCAPVAPVYYTQPVVPAQPVVIAPCPVTYAPAVYPCSGYGSRYIPRYCRPGRRVYTTYY